MAARSIRVDVKPPGEDTHVTAPRRDRGPYGQVPPERGAGRLGRRVKPFAAVTALGLIGALLPGGLRSGADLVGALILLAAVALALGSPWSRLPRWVTVVPALGYVGFVALLMAAQGGIATGSFALVLVAVVWVACFHRRWESVIVVLGVVAVLIGMSAAEHCALVVIVRRVVLWAAVCGGISAAVHQLRGRLWTMITERDELLHQARTIEAAAEELTGLRDPHDVIGAAVRIAAELASPPSREGRRATYFRVEDGEIHISAQFDETGTEVDVSWPLSDHPPLSQVVETGVAVRARLADHALSEELRGIIAAAGITHGAWVPIRPNGRLHGIVGVAGRGQAIPPGLFHHLVALSHVIELALANALAYQHIVELATTDDLTGLANRRGFFLAAARHPGRRPYAIISADVDGLKATNDRYGHAAGDELLDQVSRAMRVVLRRGDLAARVGGDEFAILLHDADARTAQAAASRILEAIMAAPARRVVPRLSLGIALGGPDTDPVEVHCVADRAMYDAKRRGGMTWVQAPGALTLH